MLSQEGEICVCQRIVGNNIKTSYVQSCGTCELRMIPDPEDNKDERLAVL